MPKFLPLLVALALCLATAATADARPVLVLGDDGRVRKAGDRHLPRADLPRPPAAARTASKGGARARHARRSGRRGPSFRAGGRDLLRDGTIDARTYRRARNAYVRLKRLYKKSSGTQRTNLRAVVVEADDISKRGFLSPSRMNLMTATLDRNYRWWRSGRVPRHGQRILFEGSEVVWQFYSGEGLQLQQLANFGKANALWRDERRAELRSLLDELIDLGSDRGGALAFEYLFEFGGGEPPWTSGLSQATAVQSLARAGDYLGDPRYRDAASRGLGVFEQPPPLGVRVDGEAGPHFLIYTFNPDLRVINAFLQSVIGLYDYTQITGDPRGEALWTSGHAQAQVETPRHNTGQWSLYSLSRESDLGYHNLTRRFLKRLCSRLGTPVYCDTAQAFADQLKVAPEITPRTRRVRGGKPAELRFELSKISRVTVEVIDSRGRTEFSKSAVVGYGSRDLSWPDPPVRAGRYTLRVSAVDLAGNRGQTREGPLRVLKGKKRRGSGSDDGGDSAPDGQSDDPPLERRR